MNKKLISLCFLFLSISAFAQNPFTRQQSVYAELGGSFGVYSLNYEYKFTLSGITRLSVGTGTSYLSLPGSGIFLLGVPVNFIVGKKHNFEAGVFPIYAFGDTSQGEFRGVSKHLILSPRAGYRYEHPAGFLFRAGFTPLIDSNNAKPFRIIPTGGVSLGYTF